MNDFPESCIFKHLLLIYVTVECAIDTRRGYDIESLSLLKNIAIFLQYDGR